MNKFYFIDKPLEISSFDIIRFLRKHLGIKKMGHTGTLDPLATGGVLIATGNYTKLIPYLEKDSKEYEFDIMLDGKTASFDLGEEVEFLSEEKQEYFKQKLKKEDILKILKNNFTGEIIQIPPKYSAVKINGERAYNLARKGIDVQIKKRKVMIFEIKLLSFKYPKLSLKAKVSAGTYIRSIASDFGKILGTGGYIAKLRRTKIGNLDISSGIKLDDITLNNDLSVKEIFSKGLFIQLENSVLDKLNNGLSVSGNFPYKINTDLFVWDGKNITNIIRYDSKKLIPIRKI